MVLLQQLTMRAAKKSLARSTHAKDSRAFGGYASALLPTAPPLRLHRFIDLRLFVLQLWDYRKVFMARRSRFDVNKLPNGSLSPAHQHQFSTILGLPFSEGHEAFPGQ
jgi:hypothetical protein